MTLPVTIEKPIRGRDQRSEIDHAILGVAEPIGLSRRRLHQQVRLEVVEVEVALDQQDDPSGRHVDLDPIAVGVVVPLAYRRGERSVALELRRHPNVSIAQRDRDVPVANADLANGGDRSARSVHPLDL